MRPLANPQPPQAPRHSRAGPAVVKPYDHFPPSPMGEGDRQT